MGWSKLRVAFPRPRLDSGDGAKCTVCLILFSCQIRRRIAYDVPGKDFKVTG